MLEQLFPNLIEKMPEFIQSIIDTFVMLGGYWIIFFNFWNFLWCHSRNNKKRK